MKEMKVLLCIGGRVYGEYAASFVAHLTKGGLKIDCTLLYVNPETKIFRGQKFPTPKSKTEIDEIIGNVESILKNGGIEEINTIIREGEPSKEILEEADKGYQMVVTGTHGATGLDRVLFDSVASQVAEHASIPVLVVRDDTFHSKTALVAIDGSEPSIEAVYCGGYLAKRLGFDVKVLSVAYDAQTSILAEEAVEEAKNTLKEEFGIEAHTKVLEGNPPDVILNESGGKDLIVMGARGHSWIQRLLVGHVSQKVLANEDANVLIVRNCEAYRRKAK